MFFDRIIQVVFRSQLARKIEHPGDQKTEFLCDLQRFAMKAYPRETKKISDQLVVRGFLEGIRSSQVPLDLRKTVGSGMKIEKPLETALHLEAVARTEEEKKEPE